MPSISSKTAVAGAWLFSSKVLSKIIDFTLLLVLARLLQPADFAIVAIAMVFVQFTEAVLEIPLGFALIRAREVTPRMIDTAFTLSLLRAIFVAGLLAALGPVAAEIFDEPRLPLIMAALALAPAMRGMASPRLALFGRALNYRPEALIDLLSKVAALLLTLPVALATRSYWALALATVSAPVAATLISYVFAPYRPRLSLGDWRAFADLLGWNTATQALSALSWQADMFVLGAGAPRETTGRFSVAQQLASAPHQMMVTPAMRTFFSAFADLRSAPAIGGAYLKASTAIFTVAAPIYAGLALLAEPAVAILLEPRWSQASYFLTVLPIAFLLTLPVQPIGVAAYTLNRAHLNTVRAGVELVVKAPLLVAGLHYYGLAGFVGAQLAGAFVSGVAGALIARNLLGVSLARQAAAVSRALGGLASLAIVVTCLKMLLAPAGDVAGLVLTCGLVSAGAAAYCGTVYGLWRMAGAPDGVERLLNDAVVQRFTRG